MEDVLHMFLFVVWLAGFSMLMYGVFWQPYYSDFNTDAEYNEAAKPIRMYRYVGGAMIFMSIVVYNAFV